MKKTLFLTISLLFVMALVAQAVVIWNFDAPATNPSTVVKFGTFYAYTNSTSVPGFGNATISNALRITVPAAVRSFGGGFDLSNSTSISISGNPFVSWAILANDTSPFGVTFEVTDTSASKFIPAGTTYSKDSQQFAGAISTTAFQTLCWNVGAFHKYLGVNNPDIANLTKMTWVFQDNTVGSSGSATLKFYLDDVAANSVPTPVELSNFEAVISKQAR